MVNTKNENVLQIEKDAILPPYFAVGNVGQYILHVYNIMKAERPTKSRVQF